MHTVTTRIYDVDSAGQRYLRYRPGDVISDDDAKRAASLVEPAVETPAKPIDHNTNLSDLRAICAAEDIDSAGANTRAEFREIIEVGRAAAGAQTNERPKP